MARRNDQVFQLSLTELAFTIAFLLLLLLGSVVFHEQQARAAAEAALAQARADAQAASKLSDVKREFEIELKAAGLEANDKTISALAEAKDARAERERLKRQVEDLDAKLSALVELQKQLAAAAPASAPELSRERVVSALALEGRVREVFDSDTGAPALGAPRGASAPLDLNARVLQSIATTRALQRQLKTRLGIELAPGQEARTVDQVVDAAGRYLALQKSGAPQAASENADLRGQVAFLQNRLNARGGRDFPPCWADDAGKVEFLFAIALTPAGVTISPAWPARRDAAARALPGVADALGGPWSNAEFEQRTRPILADANQRAPACRHYVELRSTIADAVQSDRARLMVEGVFYKVEERR